MLCARITLWVDTRYAGGLATVLMLLLANPVGEVSLWLYLPLAMRAKYYKQFIGGGWPDSGDVLAGLVDQNRWSGFKDALVEPCRTVLALRYQVALDNKYV